MEATKPEVVMIVSGSRHWTDKAYVFGILDSLRQLWGVTHVVQGGAKGVDKIADDWAEARGIPSTTIPADWSQGKKAGHLRNGQMLKLFPKAKCVAFPIGESKGTRNFIKQARDLERSVKTFEGTEGVHDFVPKRWGQQPGEKAKGL